MIFRLKKKKINMKVKKSYMQTSVFLFCYNYNVVIIVFLLHRKIAFSEYYVKKK